MIETNLTLKEVAAHLKVSLSTVRRLIRNGELQCFRIGTQGQVRVPESALKRMCGDASIAAEAGQASAAKDPVVADEPPEIRILGGVTRNELRWSILHADVNAAAASLPAESVNCVVTSPPYYWQRDYEVDGQIGHESTIDGYVDAMVEVFSKVKAALTQDGTLFLNLGDTYYSAKGKPHGTDDKHNGRNMMRKHLRAVDGPGLGLPRKSLIGIPWRVALALQECGRRCRFEPHTDRRLRHGKRAVRAVNLKFRCVPTGSRQTRRVAQIGIGVNTWRALAVARRTSPVTVA